MEQGSNSEVSFVSHVKADRSLVENIKQNLLSNLKFLYNILGNRGHLTSISDILLELNL